MKSVGVQFSGKPAVYNYYVPEGLEGLEALVGTRVIVPNKLKDDGTLSLTIATVVEVHDEAKGDATKPVIQVLSTGWIDWATATMKELAAENHDLLATKGLRTYRTQPGENLGGIALRELGDVKRWPEIMELNGGEGLTGASMFAPGIDIQLPVA